MLVMEKESLSAWEPVRSSSKLLMNAVTAKTYSSPERLTLPEKRTLKIIYGFFFTPNFPV